METELNKKIDCLVIFLAIALSLNSVAQERSRMSGVEEMLGIPGQRGMNETEFPNRLDGLENQFISTGDHANVNLLGRWANGRCLAVDVSGSTAYFGNGGYLEIVDFTDPANPAELGRALLPGPIYGVSVSGNYAYVANHDDGLRVIDVSDPTAPFEAGFFDTGGSARDVAVSGDYAYVAERYDGLRIIDISDPTNPFEAGSFDLDYGGWAECVAVSGDYAYVGFGNDGLFIVDVSDPTAPFEAGVFNTGDRVLGVDVLGGYAYVADGDDGLRVIDVSNPAVPFEAGFFDTGSTASGVTISESEHFAYVADGSGGLRVINVSDPTSPSEVGFYDTASSARGVSLSGSYAYVADNNDGLRVINVSDPASPSETGFFESGSFANDVAISGSYAFVAHGNDGLRVIDVSDPTSPFETGFFDTGGYARSVIVSGDYAYVADDDAGLRVIDVSDPTSPFEAGFWDTGSYSIDVALSENYAYVADYYDGLRVIDVSDPTDPFEVGFFDTSGRTYGVAISSGYAYLADWIDNLRIIDISDPANPFEAGHLPSGMYAFNVAVSGSYAYMAAWADGIRIIDVSDPTDPFEVGFYDAGESARDVAMSGNYVYAANTSLGLRVIDVTNPVSPFEAGFYDTGDQAYGVAVSGDNVYVADGLDGLYNLEFRQVDEIITVTYPNGGEWFHIGDAYNITWTSNNTGGNVRIEYSSDAAANWQTIVASTTDDGVHSWTIPDAPSLNCLIRIMDTDGAPTDQSDGFFRIEVDMAEHNNNNVVTTVFNNGLFGADHGPQPGRGDAGFQFNGPNALYEGDLVIAQSETQVSGRLYGSEFNILSPIDPIASYIEGFDQVYEARYNDDAAPNPIGIRVVQRSNSKPTSPDDDYVILDYEITNNSGSDLTGLYVGLAMDWDIGSAANNLGGYDSDRKLSYLYEADVAAKTNPGDMRNLSVGENNKTSDYLTKTAALVNSNYYGVSLLSGQISGHTIWSASGGEGDDAVLYGRMTSFGELPTESSDIRSVISGGPYHIPAGGHVRVVYAVLGGTDLVDLQANAEAAARAFSPQFSRITTGVIVNDWETSDGCSWNDYDNDGDLDLFVATKSPNSLYTNNGDGTFTQIMSGSLVEDALGSKGCSWADFDNDGDSDLFVANAAGQNNILYENTGSGSFTKITAGPIVSDGGDSYGCSWGDYDNDGHVDIFIANGGGENNFLYKNMGSGNFIKITTGPIVTEGGDSRGCSWADYDSDGDLDLFVANGGENNFLYENKGGGNFEKITTGPIVTDGGGSKGGSWGDNDNDGDPDLFVTNSGDGENNFLYENMGGGNFIKITSGPIVSDGGRSRCGSWGDYDNDGDLDLFVTNQDLENNFLYTNNGDGTFNEITTGSIVTDGGSSRGCSWGDYDNDGDLDLFVANREQQNDFLYSNNGNSNHWINIQCIGTVSNTSAIGAKVRVKATINGNPVWQMNEISGQTGGGNGGSQNSLNAEFGLGDATFIDSVQIDWPSGGIQILTNIEVNQFLSITEFYGPFTPQNLSAVAGNQQITLLWSPNIETGISHYNIYRSETQGFTPTASDSIAHVDHPDTSYVDTGLTNGQTYYYRISAVDDAGNESAFSDEVSAIPSKSIVVTSTADSGPGTLRQALLDAENGDKLRFDTNVFQPNNPGTISITSGQLPTITQGSITVDASDAGVIIDGSTLQNCYGFSIQSDSNVIKGLKIQNFPHAGIHLDESASYNIIGGNRNYGTGINGEGNTIIGSGGGIAVYCSDGTGNIIIGNHIGVDETGVIAIPNERGINIRAPHNTIGSIIEGERNVVSGNRDSGIWIETSFAHHNTIIGNYIGVNAAGTDSVSNGNGMLISEDLGSPSYNVIGGSTEEERNIISGNRYNGVSIQGSGTNSNNVKGNYIGTDVTGTKAIPNEHHGVFIYRGASDNVIGGGDPMARNIISSNLNGGISISGAGTDSNRVIGNYVGTGVNGASTIYDGSGISISNGAQRNIIGGTSVDERNIIGGYVNGILISQNYTDNNTIVGNYIGVDSLGTIAMSNTVGVAIYDGAANNTIGPNNIISLNNIGIQVSQNSLNNVITGNIINDNSIGQFTKYGVVFETSSITISRNTIVNHINGGVFAHTNSSGTIKNNIIFQNHGNGIEARPESELFISYNNLWNNDTNYDGCSAGIGDISADPQFVDPDSNDYNLQPSSPCIDAGDPESPLDPDGTRADMGALFFDQRTFFPQAPLNLFATVGDRSVTLSWSSNSEFNLYQYRIYRSQSQSFAPGVGDLIAQVEATDTSFTDTELINSTTYYYRISAVTHLGNESTFSDEVGVMPGLPPVILHTAVTSGNRGEALIITTNAEDADGIRDVLLYFRRGGETQYAAQPMAASGGSVYASTIPGNFVTERGLEYYVGAADNNNNTSTDPSGMPGTVPHPIVVIVPNLSADQSTPTKAYRMVSIPLNLYNKSVGDIFLDDFGGYDPKEWRLYRYQNGSYVEYEDGGLEETVPGLGYWLITKNSKGWDTGSGQSVGTTSPVRISLSPGWNMIGCPFSFPVSWSDVDKGGYTIGAPVGYSGEVNEVEGYDYNQMILSPWRGYLVQNMSGSLAILEIPAKEASSLTKEEMGLDKERESGEWEMEIVVEGGRYQDRGNCIGVYKDAEETWDRYDYMEVPAFGDFVRMTFPHADWKKYGGEYSGDYRPENAGGHIWQAVIQTRNIGGEVKIEFRGLETVPEIQEIRFVDESLNRIIDPRVDGAYRYPVMGTETARRVQIIAGKMEYVEKQTDSIVRNPEDLILYPNYPNPFNNMTMLRFGLPETSSVSLRVYDIIGREVRTLLSGSRMQVGIHEVLWDGRNNNGKYVGSGIYIVILRCKVGWMRQKVVLVE